MKRFITHLIGRWHWEAPAWPAWIRRQHQSFRSYLAADRKRSGIFLLAVFAAGAGFVWYWNRPIPHYVKYAVTDPPLTEYNDKGISSIKPMRVVFTEPVAQLKQVEKRVTTG